MFKTNLQGLDKLLKKMAAVPEAVKPEISVALNVCAFRVQRTAKRSIQNSPPDPETGRSKPGNPPKTDTGRLVNSVYVDADLADENPSVKVGTNVAYGRYLEFGTQTIEPRPWLQPAMEANRAENVKTLSAAAKKALKNIGKAGA